MKENIFIRIHIQNPKSNMEMHSPKQHKMKMTIDKAKFKYLRNSYIERGREREREGDVTVSSKGLELRSETHPFFYRQLNSSALALDDHDLIYLWSYLCHYSLRQS